MTTGTANWPKVRHDLLDQITLSAIGLIATSIS
jgi:hypothetical protein